ncbi:hypothetical protein MNBD_BACTEROID01-2434 [hydrothermal vent metagenome]|uniref:Pyrrolo-quinoline quinone repeat domain-containing protein n=1 Tax=hydrothermal vent metagenome TaxID=652676 RepID=A0A3B0UHI8_9ZZZZ
MKLFNFKQSHYIKYESKLISMNYLFAFLLFFTVCFFSGGDVENWTHFRGSTLDGHSATERAPVHFGAQKSIVWETSIEGIAYSSPVVFDDQIWLTSATQNGEEMFAICLDYASGGVIRKIPVFQPSEIQHIHPTNSYATPTPCIEGGVVYVHYGTYGTAAISTSGFEVIWQRTDLNCSHMQGAASSPVIYNDLLILHLEGTDVQYVIALDKRTGKTAWKTERPQEYYKDVEPVYRKAYITPIVVDGNGQKQLISNGSQLCVSYDPDTGEELWRFFYGEDSTVGMPLYYDGMIFINSGWVMSQGPPFFARFFAINLAGEGDVTVPHLIWESETDIPQIPTPVIVDGKIYMVHDRGAVTCLDAKTGRVVWKDKLKGQFNASPVYAGGNIYFSSVQGVVYVVKPGDKFTLVAENKIGGRIKATPAILRNSIIIRTDKKLYRFEEH